MIFDMVWKAKERLESASTLTIKIGHLHPIKSNKMLNCIRGNPSI